MANLYSYGDTMAMPCRACGGGFRETDPCKVFAERRFHERCFNCAGCKMKLVDQNLAKAVRELPYCSKCFPRANATLCGQCNEPITGKILTVKGIHKKFHPECFKCAKCGTVIGNAGFRKRPEGPVCVSCPISGGGGGGGGGGAKVGVPVPNPSFLPKQPPAAAAAAVTCTKCSTARVGDAKFCGECGGKF